MNGKVGSERSARWGREGQPEENNPNLAELNDIAEPESEHVFTVNFTMKTKLTITLLI